MESRPILLWFVVSLFVLAMSAHSESDEEYWGRKEQAAKAIAKASYVLDPFSVANSFNAAVHKDTDSHRTRRSLSDSGSCKATNPIDRCWRCRTDWANNRQKLANCAKGFGRLAYGGGKHSEIYVVTDSSDDDMINPKYGTLRWGVIQEQPLWIVFSADMTIVLQQELIMTSWKTIDGRGFNVHIAHGSSIMIQYVSNIIIHGLHIHDIVDKPGGLIRNSVKHYGIRTVSDGDGISIFGSSNIWIDHNTISNCKDGLIDAVQGSTAITISNGYYTDHDDVMLLGASDAYTGDWIMQVTLCFNHFGEKLVQRMPRARHGFVHIVNNDYTEWEMYAIGGSAHPTLISQGNRFKAKPGLWGAKEVTKREYVTENVWSSWNWTSDDDTFLNGAYFVPSGVNSSTDLTQNYSRYDVFRSKPGSFVARLTRYVGALQCKVGEPC